MQRIDNLRSQYDPLAEFIQPHVTLVFPFESDISHSELSDHIVQATDGLPPFTITLSGITGADNEYLFLNVKEGNDSIIQLHDRLYSGILKPYLNRTLMFVPHLTVGRIQNRSEWALAIAETEAIHETFTTTVDEISVERIDELGRSILEFNLPFGQY